MKFILSALFAVAIAAPAADLTSPQRLIIKFKNPIHQSFNQLVGQVNAKNPTSLAPVNKVKYNYNGVFSGVAGTFNQDFLNELKAQHSSDIEYIEKDGIKRISKLQATSPNWGLSRISERDLNLSRPYTFPTQAGAGINIYIVDTGIQATHTDFGGRAKMAKSFVANETETDLNGHGTHCAGVAGSKTYGVAKQANIFGVKVLNGQGEGTDSDVIAGINYVADNAVAKKTVLSMSLGGDKTQALDDAVNAAVAKGVVVVVAAGNDSADSCGSSPSGAASAFAVGATDKTDAVADFSDYGKCVKIFAPGVDITSLWKGKNGATNTISGTSMATPHVAGAAALFMSVKSYSTAEDVYAALQKAGTPDKLTSIPDSDSPNVLLYNSAT